MEISVWKSSPLVYLGKEWKSKETLQPVVRSAAFLSNPAAKYINFSLNQCNYSVSCSAAAQQRSSRRQKDLHLMRMTFVFASKRRARRRVYCAPCEIIITTSVWCALPKKNPRVCAPPIGKTRLHTLLFESFVAAASVNQYIYIKIVKQMRISSTITAIFLKRYLIYQHKVSESTFFCYKNVAVSMRHGVQKTAVEFYWASTFLSPHNTHSDSCNFHVFDRNRGAHAAQQQQTTTAVRESAGCWVVRWFSNFVIAISKIRPRHKPSVREIGGVLIIRSRSLNYCNLSIVPRRRRASLRIPANMNSAF